MTRLATHPGNRLTWEANALPAASVRYTSIVVSKASSVYKEVTGTWYEEPASSYHSRSRRR